MRIRFGGRMKGRGIKDMFSGLLLTWNSNPELFTDTGEEGFGFFWGGGEERLSG